MVTLSGRGWGHGVGMCQWGAMQLSKEGVGFERILKHYYPGTTLQNWYDTPTAWSPAEFSNKGGARG